jgi:hypothetical protein
VFRPQQSSVPWNCLRHAARFGALLFILASSAAVERTLNIEAPETVISGRDFAVTISAGTDAGQGEQVGFLQAEYSIDQGRTWTAICYLEKAGAKVVQPASLKPGPAGSVVLIRVRAAYRDGLAGDVDHTGAAIRWREWWANWVAPAAMHAQVPVK